MHCPFCHADALKVLETRVDDPPITVRRRRRCAECGQQFYTREEIDTNPLVVVDGAGRRAPFDRGKLSDSLALAGIASLPHLKRDTLAELVIHKLLPSGPTIRTCQIVDACIEALRTIDPATCVRYAMVYKNLQDIDDVLKWLHDSDLADPNEHNRPLLIVKSDGTRETFDDSRVALTLRDALSGSPTSLNDRMIDAHAESIRRQCQTCADTGHVAEVHADTVTTLILETLGRIDKLAELRFALTVKRLTTYNQIVAEALHIRSEATPEEQP